jgi:hypothetical protein
VGWGVQRPEKKRGAGVRRSAAAAAAGSRPGAAQDLPAPFRASCPKEKRPREGARRSEAWGGSGRGRRWPGPAGAVLGPSGELSGSVPGLRPGLSKTLLPEGREKEGLGALGSRPGVAGGARGPPENVQGHLETSAAGREFG